MEELDRGGVLLIGKDGREGESGMVVDDNMHILGV